MDRTERVVLIGFSGTGKTTVSRLVAGRLGWSVIDLDAEIERVWQSTIPAMFRDAGEREFRERERAVLREALTRDNVVVASGGGAPAQPGAWNGDLLGTRGTLVVALDAPPETSLARLQAQSVAEGESVERPLLAVVEPLDRIRGLKAERQSAYDLAQITLSTDGTSPDSVAAEIAHIACLPRGEALKHRLEARSGVSEIEVGPNAAERLGTMIRARFPATDRIWIVTDSNVGPIHAGQVLASLRGAGFTVEVQTVAAGEGSKSLSTAGNLYDWLLGNGIERNDALLALGGGVVGDLAGFVAATVLRGVGFVQLPTTLLAAVDSSVGGKTGINHRAGKNLIGAFLQPQLVVVDTTMLRTMPARELRSGWAEVVKHAVIQRSTPGGERGDLAALLERNARQLLNLQEPALSYLIWRNIQLKSAVVAADEREGGIRAYLNFGHTLGHAIEASDYNLLHGEAVALGMRAAAALGMAVGSCGDREGAHISDLLALFGLPTAAQFDEATVLQRMTSDKKRRTGKQRFILPIDRGGVGIFDDVPELAVLAALRTVQQSAVAN